MATSHDEKSIDEGSGYRAIMHPKVLPGTRHLRR
jgi:hypothetical protein